MRALTLKTAMGDLVYTETPRGWDGSCGGLTWPASPSEHNLIKATLYMESQAERFRSQVENLKAKLEEHGICPNCDNVGWYVEPDPATGEPMQVQCEWCDTTEHSLFNRRREMEAILATLGEALA